MLTIKEAVEQATQAHRSGDFATAEILYDQITAVQEIPEVLACAGTMYAQSKAFGRAIVFLKHALSLDPNNASIMANLAAVYRGLDDDEKSVYWNMRSISIEPENPSTLSNLSGAYINNATPWQALAWANKALAIKPDLAEAQNHRALALLELGRFEDGWKQYDGRMGIPKWHKRPYTCPQWKGERTKLLAISGEQGLGDEIMFLTCLQQIRPMVDGIVLEVATRLVKLIQNSFPDLPVYGTCEDLLEDHEPTAWTHMGSLPGFIWPVKPSTYLKPSVAYPKTIGKPRIGISWRGGTIQTHEKFRNFPLEQWKWLVDHLEGEVVSLQYGNRAGEAGILGIPHDAPAIADLGVLAAMVESCDLVISVTNTTVHMAGALGVPCMCLVPSRPSWRYGMTAETMPWYRSVHLIRQAKDEPWQSVVERLKQGQLKAAA